MTLPIQYNPGSRGTRDICLPLLHTNTSLSPPTTRTPDCLPLPDMSLTVGLGGEGEVTGETLEWALAIVCTEVAD
jgi:hypothetical protein